MAPSVDPPSAPSSPRFTHFSGLPPGCSPSSGSLHAFQRFSSPLRSLRQNPSPGPALPWTAPSLVVQASTAPLSFRLLLLWRWRAIRHLPLLPTCLLRLMSRRPVRPFISLPAVPLLAICQDLHSCHSHQRGKCDSSHRRSPLRQRGSGDRESTSLRLQMISNVLPPPAHVLRLFLCEIPVPAPCWDLPRGCDAPAAARHLGGFLPLGQAVPRVAPPVPSSAPPLPPCLGRRLRLLAWIPPLLLWRDRRGLRLSGRRSIPGPRPHLLHFPLTPPPVFGWPGVFLPPCRPQSLFPGRGEAPLARASDLARRVAVPLLPANGIPQCGDGDCDRLRFRETFPSAMATHSLTRQISRRLLHRASNYLPVGPVLPRPDLRGRPAS
ncbi:unnamed protein product [Closterium sp. NIES-53]